MAVTTMDQAVGLLVPSNCRLCHGYFQGGPCDCSMLGYIVNMVSILTEMDLHHDFH